MKIKNINNKIQNLFNSHCENDNEVRIPIFYHDETLKENSDILFVGLNPAHGEEGYFEYINKNNLINEEKKSKIIEGEKLSFNNYTYYNQIHNFIKSIGNYNYSICDLFEYRETSAKELEKIKNKNNDFFEKQYDIFLEIIKYTKPKTIIVLNGYASKVIKVKIFGNENQDIDLKKGYWECDFLDNGNKIKTLFTGMLSGQRALDIGTREILKYNIYRSLKEIK